MSDPKAECERLMNALVPFAEQMLRQYGEFFPFGGGLDRDKKIVGIATNGGSDHPTPDQVVADLKRRFVEGAQTGDLCATALVFDVNITVPTTGKKSDAIAVVLDHQDDYSVKVFFTYRTEGKEVTIGEVFADEGTNEVFGRRPRQRRGRRHSRGNDA